MLDGVYVERTKHKRDPFIHLERHRLHALETLTSKEPDKGTRVPLTAPCSGLCMSTRPVTDGRWRDSFI